MTGFDTRMSIARQRFEARFSARNSVNMTCYTFSQFMVTVAPFFRQGSARWTLFIAVTMMHNGVGAGVGTGAKGLAMGGLDPTSNRGVDNFGPAITGQLIKTDIGTS
jgi:hypothetical protein